MLIFVIPRTKNQSITVKGNNIALGFATASSQEGSGIAKRIPRGVVPEGPFFRVPLWNHPPHDLDFVSIVLPS
jgi:hypothetical protein